MPRIGLSGGAYQARSVIASAQRSLNLMPEPMPQVQGEPAQFAHYPTPGLTLLGTFPQGPIRGIRQATNDNVYVCAGSGIYLITGYNPLTYTLLGSITTGLTTPVSMQDNSLTLVIVDGTTNGWQVDLGSNAFSAINDPTGMFDGADRVDYLDTYLLFNKPGTPQFYSSLSLSVTFDSLYFANKSSYPDKLVSLAVAKREIWLIGERTTEIWYDAGSSDFPFGQIPATFVDRGCIAKYSVATYDDRVYWLTLDRAGGPILVEGFGYQTNHLSNFAVEQAWVDYPTVTDAIGFIYLLGGHAIYVLTFPTADHTWCYDLNTQLWHEWLWVDNSGVEHRSRCNCAYAMTWGAVFAGDWQNGNLYQIDHNNYTDNGQPIKRQRSWPHVLNDGKRMFHREFIADIETGMGGPAPSEGQELIECFFDGPDGTLVENYAPSATELNATWSLANGPSAVLAASAVVSTGSTPTNGTWYMSTGPAPPSADYSAAFRVLPTEVLVYSVVLVAVRATAGTIPSGYFGGIGYSGSAWYAQLQGATLTFGAAPPDGWFDCLLSVVGTLITLQVQRSSDGLYLNASGAWQSTRAAGLSLTDSGATAAGVIMFGLYSPSSGSSSVALDNIVAATITSPWQLSLDWSDDRGHTYGNPVPQSMGGAGDYLKSVQWQRLGYARDRVYRLTWTAPLRTALQGAWAEGQPGLS